MSDADNQTFKRMEEDARFNFTAALNKCGESWRMYPVLGQQKAAVLVAGAMRALLDISTVSACQKEDADWRKNVPDVDRGAGLLIGVLERLIQEAHPAENFRVKLRRAARIDEPAAPQGPAGPETQQKAS